MTLKIVNINSKVLHFCEHGYSPDCVFFGQGNFQVWLGSLGHWGLLGGASTLRGFSAVFVEHFGFTYILGSWGLLSPVRFPEWGC